MRRSAGRVLMIYVPTSTRIIILLRRALHARPNGIVAGVPGHVLQDCERITGKTTG